MIGECLFSAWAQHVLVHPITMNDTSFDTIDICSLDSVTGGARKNTPAKKPAHPVEVEAPEAYGLRRSPAHPVEVEAPEAYGQGRSFCQREPFACANMRSGGNI